MRLEESTDVRFDHRYTAVQCALGVIGFSMLVINHFAPIRIFSGELLVPNLPALMLFLAVSSLMVLSAYMRSQERSVASRLTVWSTIIGGVVLYPVGTIAFVYWYGWIRKREGVA